MNEEHTASTGDPVSQGAQTSPVPVKKATEPLKTMNFLDALKQTLQGRRICRLVWETNDIYLWSDKGIIKIVKDGQSHNLIVTDWDIENEDWFCLPDQN